MDVNGLLNSFLGSQGGTGNPGKGKGGLPDGMLGGAAAGGLAALLLGTKKGRKMGGKALKYGGLAVVGGLAYKAYRDWQTNSPSGQEPDPLALPRPPADSGFDVETEQDSGGRDFRLALMRAMISAAKSDNHIDADEHARIRAQIEEMGLGAEEKAALFDSFSAPSDAAATARLARTGEQGAEIYLVSALAVDPDTPEEVRYLDDLARNLSLDAGLRGHLDHEAAAARRSVENRV